MQVDNYIYTEPSNWISSFQKFLQAEFDIGAPDHRKFDVLGSDVHQDQDVSITLTQKSRLNDIDTSLSACKDDNKSPDRLANREETHAFHSILGKILYIGRMTNPVMLYHASAYSTKTQNHHRHYLGSLQSTFKHDAKNLPTLHFATPTSSKQQQFSLETVSDASMSTAAEGVGRDAYTIFWRSGDVLHPLYWSASKLRRVTRSSDTAVLLAASDAVNTLI